VGFLFALAIAAAPAPLQAQRRPPPIGVGRVIAQSGVAAVGLPVGFVAGGLATRWVARRLGASEDAASSVAMAGAYLGATAATAAGPALVGAGSHARSSYWAALGGTAIGGVGSFLVARLNRAVDLGTVPRVLSTVLVVALPVAGATVGYDVSRRYR